MQTGQNSIAPENSLPQLGQVRLGSLDLTALQPQPQPTAKPHSRKLYLEVRRTDARADSCYQGDIGQLDKMQDTILW